MGLIRALNPLCTSATPPRKRTARAVEEIARQGRPVTRLRRGGFAVTLEQARSIDALKSAKRARQDSRPFWER